MSDINERLIKLREERHAREKARIEKLREMNLKKYNQPYINLPANSNSTSSKLPKSTKSKPSKKDMLDIGVPKLPKNNFHVNGTTKRPITAPVKKIAQVQNDVKPKAVAKNGDKLNNKLPCNNTIPPQNENTPGACLSNASTEVTDSRIPIIKVNNIKNEKPTASKIDIKVNATSKIDTHKVEHVRSTSDVSQNKVLSEITKKVTVPAILSHPTSRKSIAVPHKCNVFNKPKTHVARKSMMPTLQENNKSESVFDRLYKPKYMPKKSVSEVEKLKTDPNFLKKVIRKSELILNKRHTIFDTNHKDNDIPRRSLSAVHLKRISKSEAANCIYKWASIGDKLNDPHIDLHEDHKVKEDKVVSAVKSERKKVKFMTPVPSFNTPKPEELQARLKSWLQKRGKSLDSYHHLACFGVHLKTDLGTPKHGEVNQTLTNEDVNFDEENKENIAVESDSDDGSYADIMNVPKEALGAEDKVDIYNWRRASFDSESVGFNESANFNETTVTSAELATVDELLTGALNDLSNLLREGFDWQQAARWLRTIRERFPHAPRTAAYWECRAALEDSRGDLPASVQCWEEAIAKGTEHSVVDANLDQLLDKFMQLKISPKSRTTRVPDSKLVDVKNVFKSTIIRFAVQQAKLRRQSEQVLTPLYSVTPVRRSARLSHCPPRTPKPLYESVRQAATLTPHHVFTPNKNFVETP